MTPRRRRPRHAGAWLAVAAMVAAGLALMPSWLAAAGVAAWLMASSWCG